MTSWRDTTPQPVQDDLERLHGAALEQAVYMLATRGKLQPVALSLSIDGELGVHAVADARDTHDALGQLSDALRSIEDPLRATALVMDTTWQGGDAIRVDLDHRDADVGLRVRNPYRLRRRILWWHVKVADAITEIAEPHGWA